MSPDLKEVSHDLRECAVQVLSIAVEKYVSAVGSNVSLRGELRLCV